MLLAVPAPQTSDRATALQDGGQAPQLLDGTLAAADAAITELHGDGIAPDGFIAGPPAAAASLGSPLQAASSSPTPQAMRPATPTAAVTPVSDVLVATPALSASDSTALVHRSLSTDELNMMATVTAPAMDISAGPERHEAQMHAQTVLEAARAPAASDGSAVSAQHNQQMCTAAGACCAEPVPAELLDDGNSPHQASLGSPAATVSVGSAPQAAPSCTACQAVEPAAPVAAATAAQCATSANAGLINPAC